MKHVESSWSIRELALLILGDLDPYPPNLTRRASRPPDVQGAITKDPEEYRQKETEVRMVSALNRVENGVPKDDDDEEPSVDDLEDAARSRYDAGDLDAAAALLMRATERSHCGPSVWQNLGLVRMDLGEYAAAIDAYSHSISEIPEARINRGLAYERIGDLHSARADYEAALALFPDDVDLLVNLGTLDLEEDHLSDARQRLGRAAELDPRTNWQLSDVHIRDGNVEEAIDALRRASAAGESRAFLDIARIEASRSNHGTATEAFRAAIAAEVENSEEEFDAYLAARRS